MAQKRGSQRGVVRLASTLLLTVLGVLGSVTGCSSGEQEGALGEARQAIMVPCGTTICQDLGPCVVVSCDQNIKNTCVYTDVAELTGCKTPAGVTGLCVTKPRTTHPICCTGCHVNGAVKGEYDCVDAPTAAQCGASGALCTDCDGGDTCIQYSCDTVKGVCGPKVAVPDKDPCTDKSGSCWRGSCCTGCIDVNDTCQPGSAVTACGRSSANGLVGCTNCTDNQPVCTTDSCSTAGTCVNAAVPNNTACLDANKCDGAETCQGGKCTDQVGFTCPADANPCHAPSCDASTGCSQALLTDTSCADSNKCNGAEICKTGVCQPGTPVNCDDKNPCTVDSCDPTTGGCLHVAAEGTNCDDGNLCNGIGVCDINGKCALNPSPSCDDGNICTDDVCDPTPNTGGCKHTNNAADCSDSDPCSTGDKCSAGKCTPNGTLTCDDGNTCTTDSCKKGVGCQFDKLTGPTCNDGNDCSSGDHCETGVCTPTGGKICDPDTNPCTTAKCSIATGSVCTQVNDDTAKCQTDQCHQFSQCSGGRCPVGTPIDCDDGNPCTTDTCDVNSGCVHTNNDQATCSDNDVCTDNVCKAGRCVAVEAACDPIDDCHVAGTCNPKTGLCDAPRAVKGTACDGGTGACNDMGRCIPNPVVGAGGAPSGDAGAAGQPTVEPPPQGGEPPIATGGAGNEPAVGGEPPVASGGKGGKASGGSVSTEGGAPEEPVRVFVRDPGGCSCSVPSSPSNSLAWLGGIALVGALARRRRGRAAESEGRPARG